MERRCRLLLLLANLASVLAVSPATAGVDDRVLEVYACGADVGIRMEQAGWVVAQEGRIGAKRVDRIMAIALAMQASGKRSGYFDDDQDIGNWCGTSSAKAITVLGVRS